MTTGPHDEDAPVSPSAAAPPRTATTVVIIDDHLLLADAVASALDLHAEITVLEVAGSCAEGLEAVRRRQPDVCLLDQRLPDGLGTDLVPRLVAASPSTKVLLVTGDDSVDVLHRAVRAGSVGIITKGQRTGALQEAVVRAAAGDTVLRPEDVRRLLPSVGGAGRRLGDDLTPRERDVLGLLVDAVPTREIADRLLISHATARNHIQAVLTKLGAHTKLEAVTIARRENIVGST